MPEEASRAARREARRRRLARRRAVALGCVSVVVVAGVVALSDAASGTPDHAARATSRPPAGSAAARTRRTVPRATVPTPARRIAAHRPAPVLGQRLHNDCEATALQIVLATAGVRVDQLRLQAEFPRSGPLDPRATPSGRVWGDPELGFVGRADGGGTAGGFGIYPRPVAATAARHGVRLADLTGSPVARLYARLREGRVVMAWIALSNGPYGTWRSPAGRLVRVNFGEHTIVVTRVDAAGVHVVNPLEGTREIWSRSLFEQRWLALGRRALST